jgi:integrase
MHITKRDIERFEYRGPEPRRDVRWDDQVPGLGVRVYVSGRKSFVLSFRHEGRKRLMTLGAFGVVTLDQARDRARRMLVELSDGTDPLAERQRIAQGETIKQLCDAYLERYAKRHKKTWRDDASRIREPILRLWGAHKLTALKRADVAALHRRIGAQHPYAANRVVELLSRMYELAKLWGFLDEHYPNPARRIAPFHEVKRDRFVTSAELPRLAEAIDSESSPFIRAAFWLYLLTGMRKRELLRAKWVDIDFQAGLWRIPETKSGRVHHLPLSQRVAALLHALPREEGNPFVIPGVQPGRPLHNLDKAWRRIRTRAGLDDVRIHDLRRTAGSHLAQDGAPLHLIGRILNHRDPSTTAIYAHFQQQHERVALDRHADRLFEAAYAADKRNVVALRTG